MTDRSMLQRLRQISISSSLRGAFLTGALLTLIVSSVSLYSGMNKVRRSAIRWMSIFRASMRLF
nr:Phosphoglycerate transport system sensor protein pgtB [Klebsiella pneumoniae]